MKTQMIPTKVLTTIGLLMLLTVFFACNNNQQTRKKKSDKNELTGTISISGAFALYPMTIRWAEEFKKIHPDVRIDISAGGAGKGLMDALSGMVDLGMFSRSLTQAEIDKGTWWVAVAKDGVLCTINAKNPALKHIKEKGMTRDVFIDIFINETIKNWGEATSSSLTNNLNIYTRSDACGAAQKWGEFLGHDQESLNGIGVFGDPGIADAIKNDIYGIGYNNIIYIYDMNTREKYEGLEVVPIDLNNNGMIDDNENFYDNLDNIMEAIKSDIYPSPPARDLYFVSNGKPSNQVVMEFLRWILTDGQQFVTDCGYVQLSKKMIRSEQRMLKKNP